jgi:hypothetical protein
MNPFFQGLDQFFSNKIDLSSKDFLLKIDFKGIVQRK